MNDSRFFHHPPGAAGPSELSQKIASADSLDALLGEVGNEVLSAESHWPPLNSAHEAYAVLLEEVDELWEHVKTNQKRRDVQSMRLEAIQVASMAVRFVRDICDGGKIRR